MAKKFEIQLTPQNEEWIGLIPNPLQNVDILFNKLFDSAVNGGNFLEIISQSLTLNDLAKFKVAYNKMQQKRAEHIAGLDIGGQDKKNQMVVEQIQQNTVEKEIFEDVKKTKEEKPAKKEKKISHGFDEMEF